MRKSWLLIAVLALVFGAGTAYAVPDEPPEEAVPMGGDSVDVRVRERERMRLEYEEMRKKRAEGLAKAREETSGTVGTQVPGWKRSNVAADGGSIADDAKAAVEAQKANREEGVRRLEGTPKYFIYLAIGLLGLVIFLRFKGHR